NLLRRVRPTVTREGRRHEGGIALRAPSHLLARPQPAALPVREIATATWAAPPGRPPFRTANRVRVCHHGRPAVTSSAMALTRKPRARLPVALRPGSGSALRVHGKARPDAATIGLAPQQDEALEAVPRRSGRRHEISSGQHDPHWFFSSEFGETVSRQG